MYTYIHTYIRTYVRTYIHTYMHTYTHTYIRTYVHTYIFVGRKYFSRKCDMFGCQDSHCPIAVQNMPSTRAHPMPSEIPPSLAGIAGSDVFVIAHAGCHLYFAEVHACLIRIFLCIMHALYNVVTWWVHTTALSWKSMFQPTEFAAAFPTYQLRTKKTCFLRRDHSRVDMFGFPFSFWD